MSIPACPVKAGLVSRNSLLATNWQKRWAYRQKRWPGVQKYPDSLPKRRDEVPIYPVHLPLQVDELTNLQGSLTIEVPYLTNLQEPLTIEVPLGTYTSGRRYLPKWGGVLI